MLIGRDAELAMLDRALARARSALLLVTGAPNIGKSTLLREIRTRAEARHYRILPENTEWDPPQTGIVIDKTMTRERLSEEMQISLMASPLDWSSASNVRLSGAAAPDSTPDRDPSTGSAGTTESEARGDISAPTLVLIDGYRPDARLEDWFIETIVVSLRDSSPARVIVVAGYANGVARLKPYATATVELKPPTQDVVEAYLRKINETLPNPMPDTEVRHYIEALSADPSLIDALDRLLRLDAPARAESSEVPR
jgi:hypothetical protein